VTSISKVIVALTEAMSSLPVGREEHSRGIYTPSSDKGETSPISQKSFQRGDPI